MTLIRSQDANELLPSCAVIGCGAAAKEFVLPVLSKYPNARQAVVLVDCNVAQATDVAHQFGLQHVAADMTALPLEVDAAFITTPHKFHAPQALHFLQQGKHVFIEKPLGMTTKEVTQVVDTATARDRICMVNNYRRLIPSYQRVRDWIQSGQLGKLRRITVLDGTQFAWNSASGFYLRDPEARGVLLDRGAHTLDVLCWWLGEPPRVTAVRSDAFDGVEGLADLQLCGSEADMHVKFSRFYRLPNSYRIEGETATIVGRLFDFGRFQVVRRGQSERIVAGRPLPHYEYAWQLVENFLQAIREVATPHFLARDVAPSIQIIEDAYRQVIPCDRPWFHDDPNIGWLQQELRNHA